MDSKEIDRADRKFIDELPQYRSKLAQRQKTYRESPPQKGVRLPLVQVIAPILIAVVGGAAIFLAPDKLPSKSRSLDSKVDTIQTLQPQSTAGMAASADGIGENSLATEQAAVQRPAPLKKRLQSNSSSVRTDKAKPVTENVSRNRVATEPANEASDEKQFSLVSAVVCEGVQDRQPQVEKHDFLAADSRRVYVWMEIRSKSQPFVMKHNYYLNGAKHSEVPLKIKYPRMRTWSHVTIDKPDHVGAWKVDIVRNDSILKTVEFRVDAGN